MRTGSDNWNLKQSQENFSSLKQFLKESLARNLHFSLARRHFLFGIWTGMGKNFSYPFPPSPYFLVFTSILLRIEDEGGNNKEYYSHGNPPGRMEDMRRKKCTGRNAPEEMRWPFRINSALIDWNGRERGDERPQLVTLGSRAPHSTLSPAASFSIPHRCFF